MALSVPTTDTAPELEIKLLPLHDPAVPVRSGPAPRLKVRFIPSPVVVSQVPLVSPGMVTVLYSQVLAAEIE